MRKNIVIVGAGTAGYITALILKTKFQEKINITIVKSKDVGIIGVGEGSTEHWTDFLNFMGIEPFEMIRRCGATYKAGVYFKDWTKKDYIHSVDDTFVHRMGQELISYVKLIKDKRNLFLDTLFKSKINKINNSCYPNQFHFDTFKLNSFLNKRAKKCKIKIVDDLIDEVVLKKSGEIHYIKSNKNKYTGDLFIDCTGFKRILINKLGGKWHSYKDYLKVNSAITFQTPEEDNYDLWTTAKAMKYGWRFKIPVQGRSGNGYIFSDEYTDTDEAHKELEKDLGHKIKIIKDLKFDPGRLENVWIKNCVAVGLSANFVEPLEATSIGTSIQQAYLLMHNIVNVDESVITRYNKQVITIMDNVRDFVFLHYLCGRKDTEFWRDVNKIKPPLSLDNNLKLWKNRVPINDDIDGTVYKLFWAPNFSQVLYGLNYFDIKKIKNQFNSYSAITQTKLNWYFNDELRRLTKISEKVLHKNEIELIKMADPELHEKNKTH
tara:strand:+ start:1406 stop:2878 length:1473 start_codon:yes stop_codon:yes gene_type:complete